MTTVILVLSLLSASLVAIADLAPPFSANSFQQQFRQTHPLDSPQPDTLAYDREFDINLRLPENTGAFWMRTRFTAVGDFELRSLYWYSAWGVYSQEPCSLAIYAADNGEQGERLLAFTMPEHPLILEWNDVDLPEFLTFDNGEDFFVVLGPIPPVASGMWTPYTDLGASTRTHWSFDGPVTGYDNTGGNMRMRAGGESLNDLDIVALECNAAVDSQPRFHIPSNSPISLSAHFRNSGSLNAVEFAIEWTILNESGEVVRSVESSHSLAAESDAIFSPQTEPIDPLPPGEYTVHAIAHSDNDSATHNNEASMRIIVGGLPGWSRHDDNEPELYFNFYGFGVSFRPPESPAQLDSVRMNFETAGTANINIFLHNDLDEPYMNPIQTLERNVTAGWNTLALTSPLVIPNDERVTILYVYGPWLGLDSDSPINAENRGMGITSFEYATTPDFSGWGELYTGNFCIQGYFSYAEASPDQPEVEVLTDSLNFGMLMPGDTMQLFAEINNLSEGIPCRIESVTLLPEALSANFRHYPELYPFTIPPGLWVYCPLIFAPQQNGVFEGWLVIVNNSVNLPQIVIPITAEAGVDGANHAASMPATYQLLQNYPNPFNAATNFEFELPAKSSVELTLFDLSGREVALIAAGEYAAGRHTIAFTPDQIASGVYFYTLSAGEFRDSKKMIYLK